MNGNTIIEYIESKNGALEEAFIEQHRVEFDKFVEEEFNNEGNEDPHSQQDDELEDGVATFMG